MAGAVKKLCVLIILIFLIPPSGSFGQQNNPVISLNAINRSLESILTELTEISGYNFSYNPDKIPADTIISLTFSMKPLSEVLSSLESLGLSHRFMKNHIILRKKAVSPFSKNKVAKRRVTLSGYIRNDVTGETLIRATIADLSSGKGVATNGYGYYSFTIEPGRYDLCISYIGYKPDKISINLLSDTTILFNLVENISRLEEVIIITDNHDRTINRFASGEMEIRTSSIKNIPGILGESDVIKSFQTIPGINFYSDGSTIFHVRGGDRDQNMILIDEAPVYNPAHLLGIFSAFTPGSINNVKIFKGDMPASYGGRLSSVIDVKLKEGNRNNLAVSGNTSPVATTLNFEGPMFKKKSSFFISARRSHLKWLVASQTPSVEKLHFNDFNLKYNYRINSRNRIYLSYYSGLDIFLNHESESVSSGISWLNNAGNIRWNHLFNDRLFSNTSLIISNYDYNLFTNYETKERWNTGISLSALKYDIAFYSSPGNIYKAGIFLATHFYSPGNYYVGSNAEPVTRGVSARKAVENAIYCSFENEITQKLNIRYGLRFTAWTNSGAAVEYVYNDNFFPIDTITYPKNRNYNTYTSLEPRIGLIYKLSKNFQGKIAWSRNSQFEFLISNSVSPFTSLEAWLPASPNIKPMRSNQITTGILFNSSNKSLTGSFEAFYKEMNNYISYVDHAYMLFNPHIEGEIRYGTGESYGFEFLLQKPFGKIDGWISYSFTRTIIDIPEINDGVPFPARYDRPHSFNFYLNYNPTPKWDITANWVYTSGNPITTPTGFYYYNGYQVPFYDERNNDRLPDYHRLDLSAELNLTRPGSGYHHSIRFSIMNVYGRKNPFSINFNKILKDSGAIVVPKDRSTSPALQTSMMYIYGAIPSLSYSFNF